jgi:hypothetical protein
MTQAQNVAELSSDINSSGVLQPVGGGTGTTTSTGSGAVVLATSPTLSTPTIDKINTSVTGVSLGAGNASIMKNRIINGAMVIDQRNAGASKSIATGVDSFTLDRWYFNNQTDGAFTVQQSSTALR